MGFYTREELKKIGFKSLGENVFISDKTSIYSPEKISIGNNVRIDDFCILSGDITIGNYIHIAAYCALYGNAGIEMEDFTAISSRGVIYSGSDDYSGVCFTNPMLPLKYRNIINGKVLLKKHTIVGTGSTILPGVILEEGTAVGAHSLINKSTDDWGMYVGSPARRIKERKKDLLELEIKFLEEERLK